MKESQINLFQYKLQAKVVDHLGADMLLMEDPYTNEAYDFPFKSKSSISIIILSGAVECDIDINHFCSKGVGILNILPFQIVERLYFSQDFHGYCIVFSEGFNDSLNLSEKGALTSIIRRQEFCPLEGRTLEAMLKYVRMLQDILREEHPFQAEIAIHLTAAYYYALGTNIHGRSHASLSRAEEISNGFLDAVKANCRTHRDMDFYAEKLHLSAKHISTTVKEVTGLSAMKWIERQTILNAKSFLKNTDLTVSEVSEKMNFPTQSDFGKYFKRFTGMSPKEFRKR